MKLSILLLSVLLLPGSACVDHYKAIVYETGDAIDSLHGVAVYYNGIDYTQSYGTHYSDDGYYYGKKWQCVEFVKRYYYDYLHHKFPDGYGNANSFFDRQLKHGELNKKRNLIQFENGNDEKPMLNDLVVFDGKFGHVAIVSKVGENYIEITQQNIGAKTRQELPLKKDGKNYIVGKKNHLLGWLRIKE